MWFRLALVSKTHACLLLLLCFQTGLLDYCTQYTLYDACNVDPECFWCPERVINRTPGCVHRSRASVMINLFSTSYFLTLAEIFYEVHGIGFFNLSVYCLIANIVHVADTVVLSY